MQADILLQQGDDGVTEYEWRNGKAGKRAGMESSAERKLSEHLRDNFRIYFPSWETVAESKGGLVVSVSATSNSTPFVFNDVWLSRSGLISIKGGGTICFASKWYYAETFPRALMRECKSRRRAMLMHNKILFVLPYEPSSVRCNDGQEYKALAYIGSANLSESAWYVYLKLQAP